MTYDHWKTTEPESGKDPSEPPAEELYDRAITEYEAHMSDLKRTVLRLNGERTRYEAALRKIATWKGFDEVREPSCATLQQIAKEALS